MFAQRMKLFIIPEATVNRKIERKATKVTPAAINVTRRNRNMFEHLLHSEPPKVRL